MVTAYRGMRVAVAVVASAGLLLGCSSSKPKSTSNRADQLVNQGLQAENAGNLTAATADYQAAVKANPLELVAYYDLGVIYQQRNDITTAIAEYQKALLIDPKYKPALFNLAILDTPRSPALAVALYEQLNSFDPHDPNVLLNLGLLLRRLGQTAAGNADLAEAVKLEPSFASRIPPATPTTTAPSRASSPSTT